MGLKFKNTVIILICSTLILIIIAGLFYLFVVSGAIFSFIPDPPEPEIKYGEFPISITYEVNGDIKVVEDIIVCEFDGVEDYGSGGRRRKWKSYLKSGNKQITLLKIDNTSELSSWYGLPDYYMGDLRFGTKEEYERRRAQNFDSEFITLGKWIDGEFKSSAVSAGEALEKYGLKIIDVQYSEPIKNSFK